MISGESNYGRIGNSIRNTTCGLDMAIGYGGRHCKKRLSLPAEVIPTQEIFTWRIHASARKGILKWSNKVIRAKEI